MEINEKVQRKNAEAEKEGCDLAIGVGLGVGDSAAQLPQTHRNKPKEEGRRDKANPSIAQKNNTSNSAPAILLHGLSLSLIHFGALEIYVFYCEIKKMKGVGGGGGGKKRNSGPEALALPDEAASGTGDALAAPLSENDQTQEEKEQEDRLQDREEGEPSAAAAEEEEEDAEDEEDRVEDDEAPADDDAAAERPKLDDGFYEIEAIRRKRVRKVTL